jgi:hypothetical protein
MLPFVLREIVAGNVAEAVVTLAEWGKLQTFLRGLPGGKDSLPLAVADAPEPAAPEATDRAVAARKLSEIIRALGSVSPFGGDVVREESGRYYGVPFAHGYFMVGMVRVWSLGYVNVSYISRTAELPPKGLPAIDSRTFGSIDDAARFLTLAIHAKSFAEALAVPLKQPRKAKNNDSATNG